MNAPVPQPSSSQPLPRHDQTPPVADFLGCFDAQEGSLSALEAETAEPTAPISGAALQAPLLMPFSSAFSAEDEVPAAVFSLPIAN
ncbi:MAG: hypothetical protein CL930_12205 [Deltaproteobacteria bacterium]|nr:hypothetical protein [Deltaproteobacteria bacterium]